MFPELFLLAPSENVLKMSVSSCENTALAALGKKIVAQNTVKEVTIEPG